jgi:hypothetical protein
VRYSDGGGAITAAADLICAGNYYQICPSINVGSIARSSQRDLKRKVPLCVWNEAAAWLVLPVLINYGIGSPTRKKKLGTRRNSS